MHIINKHVRLITSGYSEFTVSMSVKAILDMLCKNKTLMVEIPMPGPQDLTHLCIMYFLPKIALIATILGILGNTL